jgi:hypothetical protein
MAAQPFLQILVWQLIHGINEIIQCGFWPQDGDGINLIPVYIEADLTQNFVLLVPRSRYL